MNIRTALLVFTSACAGIGQTGIVFGQSEASLVAGARVRLRLVKSPDFHTAKLLRASNDSVVVRYHRDRESVAIASAAVERLQISVGTESHAGAGGVIGGATGLIIGLLAGNYATGTEVAVATLSGIALGAAIGWAVGGEKWREVSPPWRTTTAQSRQSGQLTTCFWDRRRP